MDQSNFLRELLGSEGTPAETAKQDTDASTQASQKAKKPRRRAKTAPEDPPAADDVDINQSAPDEPTLSNTAMWGFREMYPEGALGDEAAAQIRAAKALLKPVTMAFRRHAASALRSEETMRRALARSYALAEALRDQPRVVNVLLEGRRIKRTKPIRDNIFLAVLKLTNPRAAPDTITRWAGALAFASANGCSAEAIPQFLRTNGIREAADRWAEMRRAAGPASNRPPKPKADPVDELRRRSLAIELPEALPVPAEAAGPFLVIAERTATGMVVHAIVIETRLLLMAARIARRQEDGFAVAEGN